MNSMDSRSFRDALGSFPTGVTIVTAITADGEPIGLTANSFSSVSLDPPLVLWSLTRKSPRFADYAAATHTNIHVLGAHQKELAVNFATPSETKFQDVAWSPGNAGTPVINGCHATFECAARHQYDGGDHAIFVCEVLTHSRSTMQPLVFASGDFTSLESSDLDVEADDVNSDAATSSDGFVENYFGYLLGRAGYLVNDDFHQQLRGHDVRPAVWRVLACLSDRAMTVSELAETALLKQPTLTKLLDQMQEDALVQRKPDPADRRRVRLVITGKGLGIVSNLLELAKNHETQLLSMFSPAEHASLRQLLERIIARTR